MKFALLIAVSFCYSCSTQSQDIAEFESKALRYFSEELLYQKVFEDESHLVIDDTVSDIEVLPMLFPELYQDGLFKGMKIYLSGKVSGLSMPYVDSLTFYEMESSDEEHYLELMELFEDYGKARIGALPSLMLKVPEHLAIMSFDQFRQEAKDSELYLFVNKAIKSSAHYYVQLVVYSFRIGEIHFYIKMTNDQNIVHWFVARA